ncbi:MAG: uroporphyrinogen-III C-methyltransferase [Hydrogenothermaceae bacterium]|nr:uroporphyrinogen-III C-methyltransferase [Hydrogenothermaceae bacterium]
MGKVYIIGCGPGDPDLLTVKAVRAIKNLDIALVDHLISEEILELIPPGVKIIYVGKQKGKHSVKQEEINRFMYEFAKENLVVGRLKGGDPYVFGRGGEELIYLKSKGIDVEIIPGITSALSTGIPVTFREFSSSFSVVSAHIKGNKFNKNWIELLKIPNHTTIVLMGLSRVKEIKEEAIRQNIDLEIPTAIISNISRKNQKVVTGTLRDIEKIAQLVETPAIIMFGEVVKLCHKFADIEDLIRNQPYILMNLNH